MRPGSCRPPGLLALVGEASGLVVDTESIRLVFPSCPDPSPDRARDWVESHVARLESLLLVVRQLSGRDAGYR
ncbi:MAG: hypothetical protein AAGF11_35395 [Myxococcota bacterium]